MKKRVTICKHIQTDKIKPVYKVDLRGPVKTVFIGRLPLYTGKKPIDSKPLGYNFTTI